MPTAFVTGATGFLGHHIVDVLIERGWQVTAMVRDTRAAEAALGMQPTLTFVHGDLTDTQSVEAAMPEGVDGVFHAAADTSSWKKDAARQNAINIGGTEAILRAMAVRGAGRLVHVSSISVFGHQPGEVDEDSPHLAADSWINYARSKAAAEACVRDRITEGFDAVIVNPTHIVGTYDTQNWARMILKLVAGDLPGIPPGGGNFANGRKVAEAIVTAHHNGGRGESYILGGPFATMRDFITEAARQLGITPPKRVLPGWMLGTLARMSAGVSAITGQRPRITPEEAAFASATERSRSDKAIRVLDYEFVPLEHSINECINTLKSAKLLSK